MRVRALLLAALAAVGCGGDGGSPTVVTPVVASVTISGVPASLPIGQSAQLSAAAFTASNVQVVNPGAVSWSSSAPGIASVDGTGKILALAAGTTFITAKVAGITGTATVVVASVAAKDTVSTLPQDFVPNLLTVPIGSTVVFAFGGGIAHNVIFDRTVAGAPTDIQIATNVFAARTFGTRGTFKYDCTVHPGMRGEVTVQ